MQRDPLAIVRLNAGRLQLVCHPLDGRVVAFDDSDAAFAFAVSLELAGAESAGTVAAPTDEPLHMLSPGTDAMDYVGDMELAA